MVTIWTQILFTENLLKHFWFEIFSPKTPFRFQKSVFPSVLGLPTFIKLQFFIFKTKN